MISISKPSKPTRSFSSKVPGDTSLNSLPENPRPSPDRPHHRILAVEKKLSQHRSRSIRISPIRKDADGTYFVQIDTRIEMLPVFRRLGGVKVLGAGITVEARNLIDLEPRVVRKIAAMEQDIKMIREALTHVSQTVQEPTLRD